MPSVATLRQAVGFHWVGWPKSSDYALRFESTIKAKKRPKKDVEYEKKAVYPFSLNT